MVLWRRISKCFQNYSWMRSVPSDSIQRKNLTFCILEILHFLDNAIRGIRITYFFGHIFWASKRVCGACWMRRQLDPNIDPLELKLRKSFLIHKLTAEFMTKTSDENRMRLAWRSRSSNRSSIARFRFQAEFRGASHACGIKTSLGFALHGGTDEKRSEKTTAARSFIRRNDNGESPRILRCWESTLPVQHWAIQT